MNLSLTAPNRTYERLMVMSKPKVYVHRLGDWYSLYMDEENEQLLASCAEVASERDRGEPLAPAELVARMQGAEAILSLNGMGAGEITAEVLREVGTVRLICISHIWGQFQWVTQELGIPVIEGSNANTIAVAEWTVAAALLGVRQLTRFDRLLKSGSPWAEPRRTVGMLCGSTVGLIGLGRIGRYVAAYFRFLGAKVIAYDKFIPPDEAQALGVTLVSLEELLRTADVVSLHLPVTDSTRNLLQAPHFALIKDGAVFINSARAALYDEPALIAELRKNRFRAYLDVYAREPLPLDSPLRSLDNVLITPHLAGDNPAMFRRCGREAIETLRDFFAGKGINDKQYARPSPL